MESTQKNPAESNSYENNQREDHDMSTQASEDDSRESLEEDNENLRAQVHSFLFCDLETENGGSTKAQKVKAAHKATKLLIVKLIKKFIWRTTKFITNETQLTRLVDNVWECMPDLVKAEEGYEERFKTAFRTTTASLLNQCRTDVNSQLRKVAWEYMQLNEGKIPSTKDIEKCTTRVINNKTERDLFVWYIYRLLPAACGNKHEWPEAKRYWYCPSLYHYPENPAKLHIPVSTEAYILTAWENYSSVWKAQFDYKQENITDKVPKPRKKKNKKLTPDEEQYVGKWTSSDQGSTIYGGWANEGRQYFFDKYKEIQTARGSPVFNAVESRGCADLRHKMSITVRTEEEWLRSKKRKSTESAISKVDSIDFVEEV